MEIGYLFILVGLIIIALETIIPGLYFPAWGIAILIYGIFLLINPNFALISAIFAGGITLYILHRIVYGKGMYIRIGAERYIGEEGVLDEDVDEHKYGHVLVDGERWQAKADEPIKKGERVVIVGVDGVSLIVKRKEPQNKE
ncbi:NfeD family protein [Methanotorris formicicus]|uniref:NfeD-like C-terminal domain-containing protein n=1 Tax=Methanotorris formicicus Mc-S-70 TaxID=647171 RepID=H1KYV1_9EURY|nr:NfeD family protein [Methanotorris formicicus]EHP86686.1 protein of unknown function DUF107 [Methanotorris formicicus Mc-S-70]